jgi:hypothetical protein
MRSSNYLRQAKRRHNRTTDSEHWHYSPEDKIVGKDSLAELLDVTITHIERLIKEGMPVEQRGDQLHDWIFNLVEVNNWRALHSE